MSGRPTAETGDTNTADVSSAAKDERKFCSSCGRTKPLLGGALVRCANGSKRWKCADCRNRSKAHLAAKDSGEEPSK